MTDDQQPEAAKTEKSAAQEGAGSEAAQLREELAAMKDNYLRALADLENHRRRWEKEKESISDYAIASFAKELLQIADGLERARAASGAQDLSPAAKEAVQALLDGVALVGSQLEAIFRRHKIEKIGAAGELFDPNWHEAMVEIPSPDKKAGEIIQLMEAGYTIAGRLLRPARVGIAKTPEGGKEGA